MMGLPKVNRRNVLRSEGMRQGSAPPRPITPFSAAAMTSAIEIGVGKSSSSCAAALDRHHYDLGVRIVLVHGPGCGVNAEPNHSADDEISCRHAFDVRGNDA